MEDGNYIYDKFVTKTDFKMALLITVPEPENLIKKYFLSVPSIPINIVTRDKLYPIVQSVSD